MKRILRYLPTLPSIYTGMFFIALGALCYQGGGIGVKVAPSSEPVWIALPVLKSSVCWILVWFGVDTAIFRSRATTYLLHFLLHKLIVPVFKPVLESILGEERFGLLVNRYEKANARWAAEQAEDEDTEQTYRVR